MQVHTAAGRPLHGEAYTQVAFYKAGVSSCKLSAVSPHHKFDSSSSYHRDRVIDGGQGKASEPSSREVLTAEVLVGEERQEEFEAVGVEMSTAAEGTNPLSPNERFYC